MKEATSLTNIIDACILCPYASTITGIEVGADDLDKTVSQYIELSETSCRTIKNGKCKIANYAIEQLFESKED